MSLTERPAPRVVHIVPALFGPSGIVGGAERYVFELARHMAARVPTTVVSFGDVDREETVGSLRIRVFGGPWYVRGQRGNPFTPAILGEIARADVVHCHQQHVLVSSIAALASRVLRRRVFATDLGGGGWDISGYISTDRWYHGHLHISEYSRLVFGHQDNPRARVILGGVDAEKFSPDPLVGPDGTILYVGRLLPHKGVDTLVKAVRPGRRLVLLGEAYDHRYREDLMALAEGKSVEFRHGVDDAALIRAYRAATCIVLPSVYTTMYGHRSRVPELLGQTLLEGMACGAPAIATDVASLPEVVDHQRTGFIVPENDPEALATRIEWLVEHPQEARRMGAAGRDRVLQMFTWDAVVGRCLDAYAAEGTGRGS